MGTIIYPCGCAFHTPDRPDDEVLHSDKDKVDGIAISVDIYNISMDCPATWKLFANGDTKGVFQLESYLGKSWSKKVQPTCLEHLAALVALLRPGCLKVLSGDPPKSTTQRYADRKNGLEDVIYYHPSLEPILSQTYGLLCIHEDTFISMADGTESKIKYIKSGDNTISISQKQYTNTIDVCDDILLSHKTRGVKLTLENGYSIILTPDHPVETQRGLVEIKDLTKDDVVQVIVKQNNWIGTSDIDDNKFDYITDNIIDIGYLCGQLLGDGCSGSAIASGTESNHILLLGWLNQHFKKLTFNPYFHIRSNYIGISGKELTDDINHGNRKTLYRVFVETLGLDRTKSNKIIPKEIFTASNEVRRSFLAGLFDADGHASKSKNGYAIAHYCSDTPEVINGIRKLLSIDGIYTYISPDQKHIYIFNTKLFSELICKYTILKKVVGIHLSGKGYGSFVRSLLKERARNLGYTNLKKFAKERNISPGAILSPGLCSIDTAKKSGFVFESSLK